MKWAKDNLDGYLNFYSISGDGRVSNWTIVKMALWFTDALNITFSRQLNNFPDTDTRHFLRGNYIVVRIHSFVHWILYSNILVRACYASSLNEF